MSKNTRSTSIVNALSELPSLLTDLCEHYEKTAPTVHAHCDEAFERAAEGKITLYEIGQLCALVTPEGEYLHPNYAANAIYKMRYNLGMDTTGHAGF